MNKKQYNIPSYIAPRKSLNQTYQHIPKKIFQTWETSKVSQGMYNAVYSWINKNPDWEYYFFDDLASRNFIKDNFPKEVVNAYDQIVPGASKADLWRYCVLYIQGGVYCDIKQELITPLNKVLPKDIEFLSFKDRDFIENQFLFQGYIYQAFICSKAKHPFLKKTIDMVVENVQNRYYGHNPICVTGPGILGQAVNICLDQYKYNQIGSGVHHVNGFRFTLFPVANWDKKITYTDKGALFFNMEYASYRNELYSNLSQNLEKNYVLSWLMNKIYVDGKALRPSSKYFNSISFKYKLLRVKIYYAMYRLGIKGLFKRTIRKNSPK